MSTCRENAARFTRVLWGHKWSVSMINCASFFYNLSACVVLFFFTLWYLLICCSRHQQCFTAMPLGRHGKASGSDGQGLLRTVSEGGGQRKLVGSVHCGVTCQDLAEAGGLLFL